jgi:hypothetical protein
MKCFNFYWSKSMKRLDIARFVTGLAVVLVLSVPPPSIADGQTRWAGVTVNVSNTDFEGPQGLDFVPIDGDFNQTGSLIELNGHSSTWAGSNRQGDFGSMILDASGYAESTNAVFQRLRTSVEANLLNSFYSENNEPYINSETGEFNPDGTPDIFDVNANAGFTDTLQYGGTATNYTSRYIFRLHGEISGEEAFHFTSLQHASQTSQTWFQSTPGVYDDIIVSEAFIHGSSPQEFRLSMQSIFQPQTQFFEDGTDIFGSVMFGQTLELIGVDLRDENGVLAAQGTITSTSGATYNIMDASAVPEPGSSALIVLATLVSATRLRRRSI